MSPYTLSSSIITETETMKYDFDWIKCAFKFASIDDFARKTGFSNAKLRTKKDIIRNLFKESNKLNDRYSVCIYSFANRYIIFFSAIYEMDDAEY